ncbi:MAG TPA: hypothetical protein VHB45_10230 [Alloacidobacterium sp.]|nr:hypothetical protein [Alloacidobacterium sp.]
MSTPAINFSDLGGKTVSGQDVDFSDLGGKPVGSTRSAAPAQPAPKWYDLNDPGANQAAKDLALGVVKGAQNAYTAIPAAVGNALNSALGYQKPERVIDQENYEKSKDSDEAIGSVVGGLIAPMPGIIPGASAIAEKIPTTSKAGKLFEAVARDANDIPVTLDNAKDAALNLMDWQRKTNLGPTLNKFLNRITNPKLGPLTYEEARSYQSLLGNMAAEDKMRLAPIVQKDVYALLDGLKADVGNATAQVGRGEDYINAMNQYRQASRINDAKDVAKDYAIKTAAGAAGVGGAYKLWQYLTGK